MSMQGYFRELPGDLLARLQQDPGLVEDVVRAGSRGTDLKPDVQAQLTEVVGGMKAALMEVLPTLLSTLPAEQREAIAALPADQQQAVFRALADQLANAKGWNDMLGKGPELLRVPAGDLGPLAAIDKAWHGLHHLLARSDEVTPDPLGQAVLGGTSLGADLGFGPARYLPPAEVARVAQALDALTDADLRRRFDADALEAAGVYPGGWSEPETLDWVIEAFQQVAGFYRGAASRQSAALLYLT